MSSENGFPTPEQNAHCLKEAAAHLEAQAAYQTFLQSKYPIPPANAKLPPVNRKRNLLNLLRRKKP